MNNALQHHGVKGQKWGVRNGPPYPLDKSKTARQQRRKSATLKDKGSKTASDFVRKYGGLTLQDQTTKAFVDNGAMLAKTVLGGSGIQQRDVREAIKQSCIKSGLKLKKKIGSLEEDCASVAPDYNPNDPLKRNNCSHCSMAYVLRRVGFDVKARDMKPEEAGGICTDDFKRYFKGFDAEFVTAGIHFTSNGYRQQIQKKILSHCKNEDGALGMMFVCDSGTLGHFISWENRGGEIKFVDAQANSLNPDYIFKAMSSGRIYKACLIGRLDNLEVNEKRISEVVENV